MRWGEGVTITSVGWQVTPTVIVSKDHCKPLHSAHTASLMITYRMTSRDQKGQGYIDAVVVYTLLYTGRRHDITIYNVRCCTTDGLLENSVS